MTEAEIRKANPNRPRVWRLGLEAYDFATQADIDEMQEVVTTYGRIFSVVQEHSARAAVVSKERAAEWIAERMFREAV
jgi:hypothetical protein